jgi:hypothetical protein
MSRRMAELARSLAASADMDTQLRRVTDSAVELIPGADCADVLMIAGRKEFRSYAATSEVPLTLDSLQERFREGPCVDAAVDTLIVRSDDLRSETRWPKFAAAAVAVGVRSMLSFQLYAYPDHFGAINLLAFETGAFDHEAESVGSILATHAALAVAASCRADNFRSALASRDTIGQAKGMIMERFDIDAIRAFELLTKLSQDTNTPVRELAARVVEQGSGDRL